MAENKVPVQPADNTAVPVKAAEPVQAPVNDPLYSAAMPGRDEFDAEGGSDRLDAPEKPYAIKMADAIAKMPKGADRIQWLKEQGWVLGQDGTWRNPDTNEVISDARDKVLRSNETADWLDRFTRR